MAHSTTKNMVQPSHVAAGSESKNFRRTKWLIDPGFQLIYLINIYFLAAAFAIAGSVSFMFSSWSGMQGSLEVAGVESNLPLIALCFAILTFLISPFICIFLSHRIAGPVFKFRKSIRRIMAGERDFTVTSRRMDNFKNLADDFNKMIVHLKKEQEQVVAIKSAIRQARDKFDSDNPESALEILRSIEM